MTGSSGIRGRLTARAAGVLAAALLVGACDGANLFEGEVAEEAPSVQLNVPTTVESGATFTVTVTARAPRGVQLIDVTVVGDPIGSRVFDDYSGTTLVESETFDLNASGSSATITIEAFVRDMNGRNSATARATVQVTSPTTGGSESG